FTSSAQICMVSSACRPIAARPPVCGMEKPILIGSAACAAPPCNDATLPRAPAMALRRPIGFCVMTSSLTVLYSQSHVEFLDQLVVVQLLGGIAREHDLAVHDHVAAVGDGQRLVKVLLGHQDGELPLVLQLL